MDGTNFDNLTKRMAGKTSRRSVLRGLIGGSAALVGVKAASISAAGKTTICHFPPGNPGNVQIISVGTPAVAAHIAHGDHVYGNCCVDHECVHLTNQCNDGVCRTSDGTCVAIPKPSTTPCDDGLWCTVDDHCDGAGVCVGTPRDCGDSSGCTADSCDESTQTCVNQPLCVAGQSCADNGMCQSVCGPGQQWYMDLNRCAPCRSGTAGSDGTCTSCPNGWVSRSTGNSACEPCPPGTKGSGVDTVNCRFCFSGTYQDEEGQVDCKICPAGTYSGLQAASCTVCPDGQYQDAEGQRSCNWCNCGGASCDPITGACPPVACSAGTEPDGSGGCSSCSSGTFSPGANASCSPCDCGGYACDATSGACLGCAGIGESCDAIDCCTGSCQPDDEAGSICV